MIEENVGRLIAGISFADEKCLSTVKKSWTWSLICARPPQLFLLFHPVVKMGTSSRIGLGKNKLSGWIVVQRATFGSSKKWIIKKKIHSNNS